MTTVLLDTHVLHWWSTKPDLLSRAAAETIAGADELALASISWFELAWLAEHGRIGIAIPILAWLQHLADQVLTVAATPAIASTAVQLPPTFPGDPADRLIYASAIERGWTLITRDERMRRHPYHRRITVW
ncbi:MAG TPA: type II toxin-antitoxin system VapC family toxin [Dehalococcoidia bacterium]|nr:type II toxin-antitoxin system VapC family toxin [Dehalococcoidia bacterium]